MPKINRARIINFSYNNNNRHILDESFDFYGGEDALLSLKNGGGKSVLVQTIFQPILPKVKLMSRKIGDFFKSKKTPTYVMLEWVLEDKGGYLLTGIGMTRRESRTTEEAGDAGVDLKYFTFIVKYREANEFDIKNIPLVKKNKKGIEIIDFKEARTLLGLKKANSKYDITVYSEEDRKEYTDNLLSYGISQEEWRSVILNINQTEGGVIEIFDKCKTSQQLLNEWILKTIEKVINGEEDKDNKKLGQMLENVVNDIIKNEKFIRDKEILETFMQKSEKLIEELNRVEECRERIKSKKGDIAELYYFTDKKRAACEEEKLKNENSIEELKAEIEKIAIEEISKEYYDAKEALEKYQADFEAVNIKISEIEEIINKLDYEERLERSAKEYINIEKLQGLLRSAMVDIERLTGECDEQKRIETLEYTLKIRYEELIEALKIDRNNLTIEKENNENEINSNKQQKSEITAKLKSKYEEFNNVKRDIKDFQGYEEKAKKNLKLSYERNILSEVEKGYFDKVTNDFNMKLLSIQNEIKSVEGIINDKGEEKNLLQAEAVTLSEKDKQQAVEISAIKNELDNYNKAEELIRTILERHHINWSLRFSFNDNKRLLEHKINEKDDELKKQYKELNGVLESLECIKSGSFNLPKKLMDFLKTEGIQYITGENYLRKLSKQERDKMLLVNPILPYSFVMTTEQIEALKDIYFDFPINQMIPLIDYKDLEVQKTCSGPIVTLKDKISFLCIYDKNIVDFDSLITYEESLRKDEVFLKTDIAHKEEVIEQYRKDLHILESFTYAENYSKEIEKKILNIEATIDKIKEAIGNNKVNQQNTDTALNNLKESKNALLNSKKKPHNK